MEAFFFLISLILRFNFFSLFLLKSVILDRGESSRLCFLFIFFYPFFKNFFPSRLKAELSNLLFLTVPGLGCRDVQHGVGYGPR